MLIGVCWSCSTFGAESWLSDDESRVLRQVASFHRSNKKNVMPAELDVVQLDTFARKGTPGLRPAASFHLMSSAIGVLQQDKNVVVAWKVAAAEGKPDLFDVWFSEAVQELAKLEFPFSTKDLSKLRPISDDLVTSWQINEQVKLQFSGIFHTLAHTKLQLLRDGLKARAVEQKLEMVDPVARQDVLCEVVEESGGGFYATMNRLTNRSSADLVNVVVILHLDVDAPDIKLHPNYRVLAGVNTLTNSLTGIGNAKSQNDQGAANQIYTQWLESFDCWVLCVIPRLKPHESVLLPIGSSGNLQYGRRLVVSVGCDKLWIDNMPVVKLADYQKKRVQAEVKRGVTWLNGDKPHVVADEKFEKDFLKARNDAAKKTTK